MSEEDALALQQCRSWGLERRREVDDGVEEDFRQGINEISEKGFGGRLSATLILLEKGKERKKATKRIEK